MYNSGKNISALYGYVFLERPRISTRICDLQSDPTANSINTQNYTIQLTQTPRIIFLNNPITQLDDLQQTPEQPLTNSPPQLVNKRKVQQNSKELVVNHNRRKGYMGFLDRSSNCRWHNACHAVLHNRVRRLVVHVLLLPGLLWLRGVSESIGHA